jgi:lipase chaperone LimK
LAEFLIEDGSWLDVTLISDSPLLEHDAMFMMQNIEKARHRQLERKAREDRRRALAAQSNLSPEQQAEQAANIAAAQVADALQTDEVTPEPVVAPVVAPVGEPVEEKKAPKKIEEEDDSLFGADAEDDDVF